MKKFRILMGAVALALVAATIIACNKEIESNVVQQATETDDVVRKPIATYDIGSGIMHDYFDFDIANSVINENDTKDTLCRFVIESVMIIDSVPLDMNSEIIRKIVILDMEEEKSITYWCIGAFVDKEILTDTIFYYVNEEVASGVYEFFMSSEEAAYVVYVNGSTFSLVEVEQLPETAMGKDIVVCLGWNCQSGCDLTPNKTNCTACIPHPDQEGGCLKAVTSNQIIGMILKILTGAVS